MIMTLIGWSLALVASYAAHEFYSLWQKATEREDYYRNLWLNTRL